VLSYLGERWGTGDTPRFTNEQAIVFSRKLWDAGGAMTWDVPIQPDGTIAQSFLDQLIAVGKAGADYRPSSSSSAVQAPRLNGGSN
jgi:hypothetical protein